MFSIAIQKYLINLKINFYELIKKEHVFILIVKINRKFIENSYPL